MDLGSGMTSFGAVCSWTISTGHCLFDCTEVGGFLGIESVSIGRSTEK